MWSHLLIASNLGIMFFFSLAVAPTIFKVLPAEWAGVYVRHFFPKYYFYLAAACILAAVVGEDLTLIGSSVCCGLVFLFLALFLAPKINAAKDAHQLKLFKQLHMLSVFINLLQMGLLTYLLTRPVVML